MYNDFIYIGSSAMTLETCQAYCGNMGYHFAGVYQSEFCSCDDTVFSQSFPLNSAMNCTLPCTGDVAQLCGGDHGISIYTSPTTTTDNLPAINATDAMQSVQKAPWTLAGCYTDQAFPNRALTGLSIGGDSFNGYNFLTNQECQAYCGALGFTFAGSEAGFACLCGNSISDTSIAHDMEYCYWPCWGNSNETCGGGWATQIYINPNPSIPLPLNFVSSIDIMTAAYAANWTDVGCYMDNGSGVLNGFSGLFENVITQENCLAFCLHNKFMYAGLELGTTCFCANEIEGTAKLASRYLKWGACEGEELITTLTKGILTHFFN